MGKGCTGGRRRPGCLRRDAHTRTERGIERSSRKFPLPGEILISLLLFLSLFRHSCLLLLLRLFSIDHVLPSFLYLPFFDLPDTIAHPVHPIPMSFDQVIPWPAFQQMRFQANVRRSQPRATPRSSSRICGWKLDQSFCTSLVDEDPCWVCSASLSCP